MEHKFLLSCESTVDVPFSHLEERQISVIFYHYVIDGKEYPDDMGRDPEALPRFYQFIADGKLPSTTLINPAIYAEYFEELLQKADNVLHLEFSSGLTGSAQSAMMAAEEVSEKYPDKKLIVIDTLCASSGYGMLTDYVADLRDEGATLEEAAEWTRANLLKQHHEFFSTDLTMYKRTGRVSGPTAAIANVFNICPILNMNAEGKLISYSKVRGEKAAVASILKTMIRDADDGVNYSGRCYICHSQMLESARQLAAQVKETFPNLRGDVMINDIGTIIGSHTGPGTISIFFMGKERV